MEYHNNILCVEGGWLYGTAGVMSKPNYDALVSRNYLQIIRRACKGRPALVAYESIPARFRQLIVERFGNPYEKVAHYHFSNELQPDPEAATYYSGYKLPDGRSLPEDKQREYRQNAEILNALARIEGNAVARRRSMGGSRAKLWERFADLVNSLDVQRYPHTLPTHPRRLKDRYQEYQKGSYPALVHGGYGNNNSRKVTARIERLVLRLYTLPNKPYTTNVHELYLQFLGGAIDLVDRKTGELFNREDFKENGVPVTLSESTIWNYLNDPKNRPIIDQYRSGTLEYTGTHRPHHHRHAPRFSLSRISMDDRDLQRKMHNGKRVKGYYAYDDASGCIVGVAHSQTKDHELFISCLRNLFRFIHRQGLGMPMEVEVEHHLVRSFKDDMMKAGALFPFVRWANPGNAQEKIAERYNRDKKYQYEKRYQEGIGRFYAKLEANRTHQEKVFDAENNTYKERTYSYEELVADDFRIIELYNNDLHPDQKRYKGMTRLDVLMECVNPNLAAYNEALLARYIGDTTTTTIRRSQYVQVQYAKYQLPSPEILAQLRPNDYEVDACWIPNETGAIDTIYLYQAGVYLCACSKITTYSRATAEHTETDKQTYQQQAGYVSQYDAMVKSGKKALGKVAIIPTTPVELPEPESVIVQETPAEPEDEFAAAVAEYSGDYWKEKARADL